MRKYFYNFNLGACSSFLLILFLLIGNSSFGQNIPERPINNKPVSQNTNRSITVDARVSLEELVAELLGSGITVSNITGSNTGSDAAGVFSGSSNLGIESGIVLTSGKARNVIGPNTETGISGSNGLGSDSDLQEIAQFNINDAFILEFDFVPQSDFVEFQYVFGSDEYREFVGQFNDAFGFFISGPGIVSNGNFTNGARNIAIIPNTDPQEYVTINGINNGSQDGTWPPTNEEYYVDNNGGSTIEYDGFTVVLTASSEVIPCETYHIKLAVGDAVDGSLDSGVFLEANSFNSTGVSYNVDFNSNYIQETAYEGCNEASVLFTLNAVMDVDITIPLEVLNIPGITATEVDDYPSIPELLTITAGTQEAGFSINPIADGLTEGEEQVLVRYNTSICEANFDTIRFIIDDYTLLDVEPRDDSSMHCKTPFLLYADVTGGLDPIQYNWSTGDQTEEVLVHPESTQTYTLNIQDACEDEQTYDIEVTVLPTIADIGDDLSLCRSEEVYLQCDVGTSWTWSTGSHKNWIKVYPNWTQDYWVKATDDCGVSDYDTVTVTISNPPLVAAGPDEFLCEIETLDFYSTASVDEDSVYWFHNGTGVLENPKTDNPSYTPTEEDFVNGSVTFTFTAYNWPCDSVTDEKILTLYHPPITEAGADDTICENASFTLSLATTQFSSGVDWSTMGDGTFDDTLRLDATYTPGPADITNGEVNLVLQSLTNTPCPGEFRDTIRLKITPLPVIDTGIDTNICAPGSYTLHNVFIENYESYVWSHDGTGTLELDNTLNPVYTTTDDDFTNGSVTITLTASYPPCINVVDQKILNLYVPPTLEAGPQDTICETDTYTISNAVSENNNGIQWTSLGDGTFDDASLLGPIYTPGTTDKIDGDVKLIMQALTSTPCPGDFRDTINLIIRNEIEFTAGADTSLCGPLPHQIINFDGINYDQIVWSSTGTGVFTNVDIDPLHPIYTPSDADVDTEITLTATASNSHCDPVSDEINAVIFIIPLINSGSDTTICSNQILDIQDADVQHYFTLHWYTDGNGSFDDYTQMNPVYTPNTDDITNGSVTLRLEADT
ncbi:MAG: choice-of-anchor L domain-containing protein, partial [Bacteroidales bacterium]|nr:choice-of-anchor L domain-containing protein [Bacteroidales bacterium]